MQVEAICTSCEKQFSVARTMEERRVEIKGKPIVLTTLICPFCGKEMTVQADDDSTLKLFHLQMNLGYRIGKTKALNGKPTEKQLKRQDAVSHELIRKRTKLQTALNGSIYQFQEHTKKLEFNEPTVKFVGEKEILV